MKNDILCVGFVNWIDNTSFAIFAFHAADDDDDAAARDYETAPSKSDETKEEMQQRQQQQYATNQLPRILVCIGDVYSFRQKHGNAVDAYCRALPYRERELNRTKKRTHASGVEGLRCRRRHIENNVLIAEAFLACGRGEDVVCYYNDDESDNDEGESDEEDEASAAATPSAEAAAAAGTAKATGTTTAQTSTVLVPAKERLNYARSYYENAREGLDDLLFRVGRLSAEAANAAGAAAANDNNAAANDDENNKNDNKQTAELLEKEKKDVSYLVLMVVGVGNALAEEEEGS